MHVTGNTRFFPVPINYIANDYNLSFIVLSANSSFMCGRLLVRSLSLQIRISGHFNSGQDFLSSSIHWRHWPPPEYPITLLSFQIPSPCHAIPLLSLTVQQDVYTCLPRSVSIPHSVMIISSLSFQLASPVFGHERT